MRSMTAFKKDQRGNVLMLTGLAILILFASAGAGVDFGRQQLVRMKLQNASDAAAVAAASLPDSSSTEQRRQVALRYFNLNFPSTYLGIARPTPNIQIGNQITVDASTGFSANFVSNVGVERLEAQGRTVVDRSVPTPSIYDVVLVMDNSGSMGYETTAPNFLSTTSGNRQNAKNLGFSYCKETWAFRLNYDCSDNPPLPRKPLQPVMSNGYERSQPYESRNQCIGAFLTEYCRGIADGAIVPQTGNMQTLAYGYSVTGNTRLNALRGVVSNFVTRIIEEGDPGSRIGLVRFSSSNLFPFGLSNDIVALRRRIDDMAAFGGTNPYLAMQQANIYAQDMATNHIKAVVLLSDGKPTQRGLLSPIDYIDQSGCNGEVFCQPAVNLTNPICTQLKSNGVQVYTVGLLNPNDQEFTKPQFAGDYQRSVDFLRNCASVDGEGNPRYYSAQNGAQLDAAFTQILASLGKIRIAQ